ncbi:type II toxin-antitoxin system HicA family toxin [Thermus sp.]|uniref:type II toxin-antitoxin system HicA family toxin n=1 Tax=Thermus sp. TaxID=275 RepID=UPI0025FFC001|nr:type II toxin-antitoxin system HicA family toxin [Thermus sp.]
MGKKRKLLEKLFALPPEMRYEDVEKVLVAFGFECVRSKGSHQQFRHPGGRMLTVPKRGGQTVTRTYLKQVIAALECVTGKALEELMEEE